MPRLDGKTLAPYLFAPPEPAHQGLKLYTNCNELVERTARN